MTVRDLIDELKEMPQDLPVIVDYTEVSKVDYRYSDYVLDKDNYFIEPVIVLE